MCSFFLFIFRIFHQLLPGGEVSSSPHLLCVSTTSGLWKQDTHTEKKKKKISLVERIDHRDLREQGDIKGKSMKIGNKEVKKTDNFSKKKKVLQVK